MPGQLNEEDLQTPLGRRLRRIRLAYGAANGNPKISHEQFAAKLNISAITYRRYERGEIRPQIEVLAAIRRETGHSLDYLIAGMHCGTDVLLGEERTDLKPGLLLRWAREALGVDVGTLANLLRVPAAQWRRYEQGADDIPLNVAGEAMHRLRVDFNYVYSGQVAGIQVEALRVALLHDHPELAEIDRRTRDVPREPAAVDSRKLAQGTRRESRAKPDSSALTGTRRRD
jgi:transcriptional regulator with XRE-family HTH domain